MYLVFCCEQFSSPASSRRSSLYILEINYFCRILTNNPNKNSNTQMLNEILIVESKNPRVALT